MMMKDTIVFIHRFPTSVVLAEEIGFKQFADSGYNLVLLDLSMYSYPDTVKDYGSGKKGYVFDAKWVIKCRTKEETIQKIKEYSNRAWFCILHTTYVHSIDEVWLFRSLKKYNCDYFIKDFDNLPGVKGYAFNKASITKAYEILKSYKFKNLIKKIGNRILTFLIKNNFIFRNPTLCFAAGAISYQMMRTAYPGSSVIKIPALNYSKYKQIISTDGGKQNASDYNYLLYIDQCPFAAPDAKLFGFHMIDKDGFFTKINNFFDRLEKITGKRVVIAATPKYKYEGNEFNGRETIYNRTGELIFNSQLVIAHSSSAFHFAVLMKKPLLFLTIKGLTEYIINDIKMFADALNKVAMDSDEAFDSTKLDEISMVDHNTYNQYIRNYLVEEPFENSIVEIIIKKLREAEYQ